MLKDFFLDALGLLKPPCAPWAARMFLVSVGMFVGWLTYLVVCA